MSEIDTVIKIETQTFLDCSGFLDCYVINPRWVNNILFTFWVKLLLKMTISTTLVGLEM